MIKTSQIYSINDLELSISQILLLRDTQGTNAKQEVLAKILDNNLTSRLLCVLLDNMIVLGLKHLQPVGISKETLEVSGSELLNLIDELQSKNVNDTLRAKVNALLSMMPVYIQEVVQGILCKTLKLGVTAKTVNKVRPNMIYEFDCMLAESGDIDEYPVAIGLKYDGVRCVAFVRNNKVTMFTRQGNVISIPPIEKDLIRLANGAELVFDGEIISNNRTSASGLINSIMKTGYTMAKGINLHLKVFDVIPLEIFETKAKSRTQAQRLIDLSILFINTKELATVSEAEHTLANNQEEVDKIYDYYISIGEEGIIAKKLSAVYEFKRSKAWLKVKAINTCTLKVIGTTEGTNDRKGKIGAFVCTSECGHVLVNVGSGLTDNDLNTITPESIIGKYVEVLFNVLIKPADSYDSFSLFLPRLKANDWLRVDKTEADTLEKIIKEHKGKPQI